MKKILTTLLPLILILSSVSQGFVVFAQEASADGGLDNFAQNLTEMIRDNDEYVSLSNEDIVSQAILSVERFVGRFSSTSTIYDNLPDNAFESKRLIVKSERDINYQDAVACVSGYRDLYILQYDTQVSAKKAYENYLKCDYINYVEPDYILETQIDFDDVMNDLNDDLNDFIGEVQDGAMSWISEKLGFENIKDELAERIKNDYILVAVLDSGVDTDHQFLDGRLEDNDVNLSSSGDPNSCEDDYGHGTHVAGIIADITLSNVRIKPYKVLDRKGKGSISSISIAVDMAVEDGADIINMSLTAEGESQTLTDSVDNAVANNVNVVVAAGNDSANLDEVYYTPASIESAITVSATDKNENLEEYSNYNGTIDIAAPGADIRSSYLGNTYTTMSGTSMAAPQVSAAIALVRSVFDEKSALEVEQMVKDFAIIKPEVKGQNFYGAGILYLGYILQERPQTPDPVFSVDSCSFSTSFNVNISCSDPDAKIYYIVYATDDISQINWFSSFEYKSPITVSVDTKIAAIALTRGKTLSSIVTVEYNRIADSDEDFYEINILGLLEGYYGSETDLIVPEVIKGKVVKGVASGAFKDNATIRSIHLPKSATKINSNAFSGCTALESVTGEGIERVEYAAFKNSSVSVFPFEQLIHVGTEAFANCDNLKNVFLTNAETVEGHAFLNVTGIDELNSDKLKEIGLYAFSGSSLKSVNLPNAVSIDINAFADCYKLTSVSLPSITELKVGLFKNCTELETVKIDSVTDIGANVFRNTRIESFSNDKVETIGSYAFADNPNLVSVILPNVTSTGAYIFENCSELQVVSLPSVTELNSNLFSKCINLLVLNLPSAKNVSKTTFDNSYIEYLRFDSVVSIGSLPRNLKGIVLPGSLTSVTAKMPNNDFVVYGYSGTYAETYAKNNGKEFHTVPAIIYESTERVSVDDTYIFVYALGFNCQYQWYRNSEVSNVGGTPIKDATNFYYSPSPEDKSAAYYCVITCSDGANINSVTTLPIENAPEYRDADYSEYYKLLSEINSLDRSLYSEDLLKVLDDLVNINISGLTFAQQDIVNLLVNQIKNALEMITSPYVMGDLNGDRNVTAIDARYVLKYAVGIQNFDSKQLIAGDMNGDGAITSVDARLILIKAVQ